MEGVTTSGDGISVSGLGGVVLVGMFAKGVRGENTRWAAGNEV